MLSVYLGSCQCNFIPQLGQSRWLRASFLPSLYKKMGKGIQQYIQKRNTCPLCRSEFLLVKTSNRKYKITPPPLPAPRQRISLQPRPPTQQQRILYLPFLFSPQTFCYYYTFPQEMISHPPGGLPLPSFFINN